MSNPTAVVVTPTCGSPKSLDAIRSVYNQTYPVHHILVVDGRKFEEAAHNVDYDAIRQGMVYRPGYMRTIIQLPFNTGCALGQKFWGHRIFAAMSMLVNEDVVCFLDEDNWYEPTHVADQVQNIQCGAVFSHSLRNICADDGTFMFRDDCESLGAFPVWNAYPITHYHLDTSSYAFHRDFLSIVGGLWYGGYAQDRKFLNNVKDFCAPRNMMWTTTGKYTLNYRLGSTADSASADFFKVGNQKMLEKYKGTYPWTKQ